LRERSNEHGAKISYFQPYDLKRGPPNPRPRRANGRGQFAAVADPILPVLFSFSSGSQADDRIAHRRKCRKRRRRFPAYSEFWSSSHALQFVLSVPPARKPSTTAPLDSLTSLQRTSPFAAANTDSQSFRSDNDFIICDGRLAPTSLITATQETSSSDNPPRPCRPPEVERQSQLSSS